MWELGSEKGPLEKQPVPLTAEQSISPAPNLELEHFAGSMYRRRCSQSTGDGNSGKAW